MANTVKIKRNRKLEKEIQELLSLNAFVKVGILSKPDKGKNKGSDKKDKVLRDGIVVPSDATVAEIGYYHEFGKGFLPQRSFLRSTWDTEKTKLMKVFQTAMKRGLAKGDPEQKSEALLKFTGAWFVGRVKKTFTNNDWDGLKDPTRGGRNKDGTATPLVDTGQLRASIAYQVIDNDPEGAINDNLF